MQIRPQKILTARQAWHRFQIPSVLAILLVDGCRLQTVRLSPLDVQPLSVDDEFVERLLGCALGRGARRVLHECALLLRNDRQVADLTELVEVIPAKASPPLPSTLAHCMVKVKVRLQ